MIKFSPELHQARTLSDPSESGSELLVPGLEERQRDPLDLVALETIMGNQETAWKYLRRFHELLPEQVSRLGTALGQKNLQALQVEIHKLKGTASMISAMRLTALCLDLEEACKTGNEQTVQELCHSIFQETARLDDYIKSF